MSDENYYELDIANNDKNDEQIIDNEDGINSDLVQNSSSKNLMVVNPDELVQLLQLSDKEIDAYNKFINKNNKSKSLVVNLDSPDYSSPEYITLQNKYFNNLVNFYIVEYIEKVEEVSFKELEKYLSTKVFNQDKLEMKDILERIDEIITNPHYKDIKIQQKLFQLLNKTTLIERYTKTLNENENEKMFIKTILTKISITISKIKKENNESTNNKLLSLNGSINEKIKNIKDLEEKILFLEDLNQKAEDEINTLKQEVKSKEENNPEIIQELEELKENKVLLENQIESLNEISKEDNPEIIQELEELKENKVLLENQIQDYLKELEELKSEKTVLEKNTLNLVNKVNAQKDVELNSEELEELKKDNLLLKQKVNELEQDLFNSTDEKQNEDEFIEKNIKENQKEQELDVKEPKKKVSSSKKILKIILIVIGVLFSLVVAWFAYAFSVTPTNNNTLSTNNIQKVVPKLVPLQTTPVKVKEKKVYDFDKKLSKEEFLKQKFDIFKNNQFACQINGKRFVANNVINGWKFRKTIPSFGKLVFTDPAETMSFAVDMENK